MLRACHSLHQIYALRYGSGSARIAGSIGVSSDPAQRDFDASSCVGGISPAKAAWVGRGRHSQRTSHCGRTLRRGYSGSRKWLEVY